MELTILELKNIEAKFMNIFERLEILEQKEPTAVTVDSEKLAKALRTNIPKDKVLSIDEVPRRYPEID
ncbi:hypothetical protein [Streptococcus parauberis]|uniref:hypothetical protein n=1 Tax=Streptococcus parauberis TaxID=1348 RepID=UPI0039B05246